MQKLRLCWVILNAAVKYLWNEQRDIFLLWGLFCLMAVFAGYFDSNRALLTGGIGGFFLLIVFGAWAVTFGDEE